MTIIDYKGQNAYLLENEMYRVIIIPALGGKVASFFHKPTSFELLFQHDEATYVIPPKYGHFADYDCSGIDDCWPNIDQCLGEYGGDVTEYPDHGDSWFRDCTATIIGSSLCCSYTSDLMPYSYDKTFTLTDEGLAIHHQITNLGKHPIEGFYTFHGLMNCEDDMTFMFPKGVDQILNVVKGSSVLGEGCSLHPFPVAKDLQGKDYPLNKTVGPSAHKCEKYYGTDPVKEGKCGAYYPSINHYFVMTYDHTILPYFGLWLNESMDMGDYNYALEPTNGYYDALDIAKSHDRCPSLNPGEVLDFTLNLTIKKDY